MPKKHAKKKTESEHTSFASGFGVDEGFAGSGDDSFSWTASEFIAHEKTGSWYALLVLATIFLAGLIYLIMRDILSGLVVVVGMALIGVYAGREPREVQYGLRPGSLWVGDKEYPYDSFRSYSTFREGVFGGIDFLPTKRFAITLTIYYHPDDEDQILAILGSKLPQQDHKQDFVDRLLRKVRF